MSDSDVVVVEDPDVVVIKVTPPLIHSVYQAVGAIAPDRNRNPNGKSRGRDRGGKSRPTYRPVWAITVRHRYTGEHRVYPVGGVRRLGGALWGAGGSWVVSYRGGHGPGTQSRIGLY